MHESFDGDENVNRSMSEARRAAIEMSLRHRLDVGIPVERQEELSREIEMIAEVLGIERIPFFIAGGTGLDLLDGKWSRDHGDLDVAISGVDRERAYDAMIAAGFYVTDPTGKEISGEMLIEPGRHNVFCKQLVGKDKYNVEIMFLEESPIGDVKLNDSVDAPRELYSDAPTVIIGEHEILLEPTEVILFHKLTDGRRKDFRDLERAWESLDAAARGRVEGYIRASCLAFVVNGKEVSLSELFSAAHRNDAELQREFFINRLGEIEQKLGVEIVGMAKELFRLYEGEIDPLVFQRKLEEKYGDLTPARMAAFRDISLRLTAATRQTEAEFVEWAKGYIKLDAQVEQRAFHEYVSQTLWECRRAEH